MNLIIGLFGRVRPALQSQSQLGQKDEKIFLHLLE